MQMRQVSGVQRLTDWLTGWSTGDNCRVICSNRIMTGQGERWRESGQGDGRAAQAKPLKPFAAQAQRSLINYEHRGERGQRVRGLNYVMATLKC